MPDDLIDAVQWSVEQKIADPAKVAIMGGSYGGYAKPLLIGQGANDPRVKQAEADQIVSAMQVKDIPVTYAT